MTLPIQSVSDTALWVAYYRALETDRPDALFRDPLAKVLIDERAQRIDESMRETSAHTRHNVVIRTVIIDRFIRDLAAQGAAGGVDLVINVGAGLDTRPYRLGLPANLRWVEIDFARLMDYKTEKLARETPRVRLERISLDLSDRPARQAVFRTLAATARKILIVTEGVLPYLTPEQVSELAEDLHALPSFRHWIVDYISPFVYRFLQSKKRMEQMKNAPFRFFPPDRLQFFESRGWKTGRTEYIPMEARKLGRKPPTPWWAFILFPLMPRKKREEIMRASGYMILERK